MSDIMSISPESALTVEKKKAIVKAMKIEHIITWCQKNDQLEWLENKMNEKVEREYYSYLKAPDSEGKMKCVLDEYGKKIIDRSKPPRKKMVNIGFMEIKTAFIDEFMPYLKTGKKTETVSMLAKLAKAKAQAE